MAALVHAVADHLTAALGPRLVAVYRFGSDFGRSPGAPQARLLVLVDTIDAALLDAVTPANRAARRASVHLRLDTAHDALRCADVLPVFALELLATRELLYGPDALMALSVRPEHLVLRLEQGLRGAHRELVRGYLAADSDPDLVRVMRASLRKALGLMRGLMIVCDLDLPTTATPHDLVDGVIGALVRPDRALWRQLVDAVGFLDPLDHTALVALYGDALGALNRLMNTVDRLS